MQQTVIITGATKGIGLALAKKFASEGFNVGICARDKDAVKDKVNELNAINEKGNVVGEVCDVSQETQVTSFAKNMLKTFGKIDILINNAGVFLPGDIHTEESGKLEKMMQTNLYSAYHLSRAIVPSMIEEKSGYIFNIASIAGLQAYPGGGSYSISKFAMIGMGKALREELKPHGIRVTNVMPGATWTASWEGVDLPEERLMKAQDIAKSVYDIYGLSKRTVVEDIVLRPQLGDL